MIIKVTDLKKTLDKIKDDENLLLSFDDYLGFSFVGGEFDLNLFEDELNAVCETEEFLTISDIEKHLKISKPTIIKLLKENNIPILDLHTFKIKKSDYLSFLSKYYL